MILIKETKLNQKDYERDKFKSLHLGFCLPISFLRQFRKTCSFLEAKVTSVQT